MTFQPGDTVRIVGGVYKRQGKAIFVSPCGKSGKMCTVTVLDGKKRYNRNIYYSSIAPERKEKEESQATAPNAARGDQSEIEDLRNEVQELVALVRRLEIRVNNLGKKN